MSRLSSKEIWMLYNDSYFIVSCKKIWYNSSEISCTYFSNNLYFLLVCKVFDELKNVNSIYIRNLTHFNETFSNHWIDWRPYLSLMKQLSKKSMNCWYNVIFFPPKSSRDLFLESFVDAILIILHFFDHDPICKLHFMLIIDDISLKISVNDLMESINIATHTALQ